MKAFNLKQHKVFTTYCQALTQMREVCQERMVTFESGHIGYIIDSFVIAPFHLSQSCVVQKDGHNIVLSFKGVSNWAIAYYDLPFSIPCEPLLFRQNKILPDTYLFAVNDSVSLCDSFRAKRVEGKLFVDKPQDFCPVFDRHKHIVGMQVGIFNSHPLCVPIKAIL